MSFLQAVNHFSEGWSYESIYAKCKSDILLTPLCDEGIAVLFERIQHLPKDEFTVVMYAYGGAIAGMPSSATAFPYRNALGCIQYALSWDKPEQRTRGSFKCDGYTTRCAHMFPEALMSTTAIPSCKTGARPIGALSVTP